LVIAGAAAVAVVAVGAEVVAAAAAANAGPAVIIAANAIVAITRIFIFPTPFASAFCCEGKVS
jgi:hypothetical protein